jgi:hypothetical protein
LFTVVSYLYVRRTKHGYRYPLVAILACAVLVSFASGTGLYALGLGGTVEEAIGDHPGFYRPILAQQRSWWAAPEKGLLGGEVATATPRAASSTFIINDFSGKAWNVDTSDLRERDITALSRGGSVRVVGAPATSSDARFHACFVFSWQAKGRRGALPPPRPLLSAKGADDKSDLCKNIRPYKQLRTVEEEGSED